jgi:hypothetical protein
MNIGRKDIGSDAGFRRRGGGMAAFRFSKAENG